MVIQIRIVIDVPLEDQKKYPEAIEHIIEAVKQEFPGLKIARPHSPVTVTIKHNVASVKENQHERNVVRDV